MARREANAAHRPAVLVAAAGAAAGGVPSDAGRDAEGGGEHEHRGDVGDDQWDRVCGGHGVLQAEVLRPEDARGGAAGNAHFAGRGEAARGQSGENAAGEVLPAVHGAELLGPAAGREREEAEWGNGEGAGMEVDVVD